MSIWEVPLADVVVTDDDVAAVTRVYRSGWLSLGPETEAFEQAFAAFVGASHAVAVSSGTAALHLACAAAGLGPGDEVIVPSLTFVATVNAVRYTGATPVFADIRSLAEPWLSVDEVEAALSPRTKALMVLAYGGHPGEVPALAEWASSRGMTLLEDAAHAPGADVGGRHLGTFGLAGAFSFFSNKNLAIGEGGMLVTDDATVATQARLMRSHGMTTLTWDRHRGHAASYDVVAAGFNYRIDEPRAALARHRLERLGAENAKRALLAERYSEMLGGLPGLQLLRPAPDGTTSAHHLFTVVLAEEVDRDAVRASLAERRIQTSVHYPPVHRFSLYAQDAPQLPRSEAYGERTLTLPLFAHMSEPQLEAVVAALHDALGS